MPLNQLEIENTLSTPNLKIYEGAMLKNLNYHNLGMFSWNPKKDGYIEYDQDPPTLRDIDFLNDKLSQSPVDFINDLEVSNHSIDITKPPYGYCYAVSP